GRWRRASAPCPWLRGQRSRELDAIVRKHWGTSRDFDHRARSGGCNRPPRAAPNRVRTCLSRRATTRAESCKTTRAPCGFQLESSCVARAPIPRARDRHALQHTPIARGSRRHARSSKSHGTTRTCGAWILLNRGTTRTAAPLGGAAISQPHPQPVALRPRRASDRAVATSMRPRSRTGGSMAPSRIRGFVLIALLLGSVSIAFAQTTPTSIQLTWTAPGDDGTVGTASQYELRYSTALITASNFSSATQWMSMPAPTAAGTSQNVTVTGLSPSTTYYFAIKTVDNSGNWSTISNVVSKTTPDAPDLVRPAPIAVSVGSVTDTTATLNLTGGRHYRPD